MLEETGVTQSTRPFCVRVHDRRCRLEFLFPMCTDDAPRVFGRNSLSCRRPCPLHVRDQYFGVPFLIGQPRSTILPHRPFCVSFVDFSLSPCILSPCQTCPTGFRRRWFLKVEASAKAEKGVMLNPSRPGKRKLGPAAGMTRGLPARGCAKHSLHSDLGVENMTGLASYKSCAPDDVC